ncbi:TPR repeat [Caballeronia arationis]|uniref:TPR repeat n=1 Tax=Caballeronia arationis TaxID=1777142 RepID=A0A7Z7I826_9BURK|nr:caspase family protein [Caballeronia arationis]SOE81014.1 TPR repeat [Caballeronia arationis]
MDGVRYALLIGNWEYQNSEFRKLVSPSHDVWGLQAVLADPQIGGFDRVDVLENQIEAKVRRSITGFFKGRSNDDMLLLYFSGHGIKDASGHLYLAAIDTDPNDLLGSGIAADLVHNAVQSCRSRKKILLIDSCFGGAFIKGMTMKSGSRVTPEQIVGDATGMVIVTATDALTYAFEGEAIVDNSQSSVFTKHLIHGLRTGEADLGRDGEVRIDELYRYVRQQVMLEIPGQSPKKWELEDGGDLVVAQNANPSLVALPKEIQETVDSLYAQTRLSGIALLVNFANKPLMRRPAILKLERLLADDSRAVQRGSRDALSRLGVDVPSLLGDELDRGEHLSAVSSTTTLESAGESGNTVSSSTVAGRDHRYGLLVGCWDYQNPEFRKLASSSHGIRELEAVLSDPCIGAFDRVDVLDNKTTQEIRVALEDFFADRGAKDLLVLYFSGHGIKNEHGDFYFAACDTDPTRIRAKAIPASFVHDVIQSCRSQKKVLIVDTFFAGAVLKGLAAEVTGLVVLAATDSMTYAFEGKDAFDDVQPSVFTKHLANGLRTGKADLEQDGEVTINELYQYIRTHVNEEVPAQLPTIRNFGADDHLVIAQNPNPLLVSLPKEVQDTLESFVTEVRLTGIPLLTELAHKPHMRQYAIATLEKLLDDDSRRIRDGAKGAFSQLGIPLTDHQAIGVVRVESKPIPPQVKPAVSQPAYEQPPKPEATPANSQPVIVDPVEDKWLDPTVKANMSTSVGNPVVRLEPISIKSQHFAIERNCEKAIAPAVEPVVSPPADEGPRRSEPKDNAPQRSATDRGDDEPAPSTTTENLSNSGNLSPPTPIVLPPVLEHSGQSSSFDTLPTTTVERDLKEASAKGRASGFGWKIGVLWGQKWRGLFLILIFISLVVLAASWLIFKPDRIDPAVRAAAESGNAEAQYNMGVAYEFGRGVRADHAVSVEWFRKSANQGNSSSQWFLGEDYLAGTGVTQDSSEAAKWFQKSADQDYPTAQRSLGELYRDGNGVPKDPAVAAKWFRKAADQGDAISQISLGELYRDGNGVPKDPAEAAKWFGSPADRGYSSACLYLGEMYEHGEGVPQNLTEAIKWYRKAAEGGDGDAKAALKRLGQ